MNCYIYNLQEYDFLKLTNEEGNINQLFDQDDRICFMIDKKIAAIGHMNQNKKLNLNHILFEEERIKLLGKLRDSFTKELGLDIKYNLLEKISITNGLFNKIEEKFKAKNDATAYFITNFEHLSEEAKGKYIKTKKQPEEEKVIKMEVLRTEESPSEHTKAQYMIKKIGEIVNCETWIAKNDKNRTYKGEALGFKTLTHIPQFKIEDTKRRGLLIEDEHAPHEREVNKEAVDTIELIDAIWFKNNQPVAAFEVETTTSIFSGLLRFCDMLTIIPDNSIQFYIVAPKERKEKVLKELRRPIFVAIGLIEYCKFITIEELELLYHKIKGLDGYVDYKVMRVIERSAEEVTYV